MVICNSLNYISCPPGCPHIRPHKAVLEIECIEAYCDKLKAKCIKRHDRPLVQCKEAPCPATA